jgi:membrane protein involved in colicin uptake
MVKEEEKKAAAESEREAAADKEQEAQARAAARARKKARALAEEKARQKAMAPKGVWGLLAAPIHALFGDSTVARSSPYLPA